MKTKFCLVLCALLSLYGNRSLESRGADAEEKICSRR